MAMQQKPTSPIAEDIRRELSELLERKLGIRDSLEHLERQIHEFEGSYLEDTQVHGNVIRGWDQYKSPDPVMPTDLPSEKFKEAERVFSMSSVTSAAAVGAQRGRVPDYVDENREEAGSSTESQSKEEAEQLGAAFGHTSRKKTEKRKSKLQDDLDVYKKLRADNET